MSVPKLLGYSSCLHSGKKPRLKNDIVLLRGLGRSASFWLDFPKYLSDWANVTMIDVLGTGKSPSLFGRGSVSSFAQDVAFTLQYKKLFPSHLVGISLGGMIAAEVVSQLQRSCHFPNDIQEKITSLSVMASSARFTGEPRISKTALLKMIFALRRGTPDHHEFAEFLVSKKHLKNSPKTAEVWNELWKKDGVSTLATLRQLFSAAFFNGQDTLKNVSTPTLFLTSRDDELVSWTNTPRLWENVTNAQMCLLSGLGHDLPTEAPETIADILLTFFQKVETSGPVDETTFSRFA